MKQFTNKHLKRFQQILLDKADFSGIFENLLFAYFSMGFYHTTAMKEKSNELKGILCILKLVKSNTEKLGHSWQSHYKEVARWEIFMELELRFGLDLRVVFHVFRGKKKILNFS